MHKLWIIVQREYLTRVKKRSFILATVLTPLAFGLFFIVVGFIFSYKGGNQKKIVVLDEGGISKNSGFKSEEDGSLYFIKSTKPLDDLKLEVKDGKYDGILLIPPLNNIKDKRHTIYYYSDKQLGLDDEMAISARVREKVRTYKIEALNLDKKELDALQTKISIDPEPLTDKGEDRSRFTAAIGAAVGGLMGMIMYMTVFIYGMMIMRGVMEEKTSRIVEVMISSVRPFQLMMGKIIGVGAVGLTQIAIWAILIPLISVVVNLVFGFDSNDINSVNTSAMQEIDPNDLQAMVAKGMEELAAINWWMVIPLFVYYFLGGYFLYASLYAAVGSAMGDDLGEGQALTIPITIPVLIAFYIMIVVVRDPNSTLAIWSSIFPLFSPIVMPARLAFNPPVWQIVISMLTLAATAVLFVWISARIYRVGILLYGKKVSFKELGKWLFYKD